MSTPTLVNTSRKFLFTEENQKLATEILNKYPIDRKRSAVIPLLDLAQRQNEGYVSKEIIEYVSELVDIPYIKTFEVASFYTMFNLKPIGKYHIQICGTTPCWLRGSNKIADTCFETLGIHYKETTKDMLFSLSEVECLGACVNAPVVQINDDYYEKLDETQMLDLINKFKTIKQ
jgi:NADH-quinone oxidoreductase subunit E